MRRGIVVFGALALVGAALLGCGRFGFESREPWREQAEAACLSSGEVTQSAVMTRISPIDGPGACGISYPLQARALASGTVGLTNTLVLGCPIVPQLDRWLNGTVQPAAQLYFGTAVSEIKAGSYSCRSRSNQGVKVSEHAFGNAVDVMSFRFADGRELAVRTGWNGQPEEQDFLREVFVAACRHFRTVLGPGSDPFHHDHFHLDLARHDPAGRSRYCRPALKFEPRLDPDRPAAAPPSRPAARPEPAAPLDIDDDADPYAVSSGRSRDNAASSRRAATVDPAPRRRTTETMPDGPPRMAPAGRIDAGIY